MCQACDFLVYNSACESYLNLYLITRARLLRIEIYKKQCCVKWQLTYHFFHLDHHFSVISVVYRSRLIPSTKTFNANWWKRDTWQDKTKAYCEKYLIATLTNTKPSKLLIYHSNSNATESITTNFASVPVLISLLFWFTLHFEPLQTLALFLWKVNTPTSPCFKSN